MRSRFIIFILRLRDENEKSQSCRLSLNSGLNSLTVLFLGSCRVILSSLFVSSTSCIRILMRQCRLFFAHIGAVVHQAFHQLLPILMFITLLTVCGYWNPKTAALFLLIGTLTPFMLQFFMKQTDGALKQDCCGLDNKHHAAEKWDLEFVFQTPKKVFSNTTKKYLPKIISYGFLLYSPVIRLDLEPHSHSLEKVQRDSPLYKLFGAGWGQKGIRGIFLKIRPHSCM